MLDTLITSINQINQFEEQIDGLSKQRSELDMKLNDLDHYVEFESFNASQGYKLAKEIKKLRTERRKVKEKLELIGTFQQHSSKLVNIDNRKLLIAEISKRQKLINNRFYNYDLLKKEEINRIIGKGKG